MNQKGNISFIFIFAIICVVVLFAFVFLAPALQTYTVRVYAIAQPVLDDANSVAENEITDLTMRSEIQTSMQNAKNTTVMQIEVLNFFYQYAWIFILLLTAIILTLYSRYLAERQTGAV